MNEWMISQYKGWSAWSRQNQWVTLRVVPQLGGRIMQWTLDGYDFFFVNPALEGVEPDETRLGEAGAWLNFGGEKIWPAPQGWDSPESWPGPPDPVMDSGVFEVLPPDSDQAGRLVLQSPVDSYTGLQLTKAIGLSENRSEVVVEATFTNQSNVPRTWSVWPVLQLNTSDWQAVGRYQVVCPMKPDAAAGSGYRVLHGLVNNPQFVPDAYGNLVVNYQYLVGKVGLDSPANWLAFCDRKTGRVLVASATYQPGMPYPEETSVQVWTQGRGQIYANHQVIDCPDDPQQTPPYLEMELLSPLQAIPPGGQLRFDYRMRACTVPAESSVRSVNAFGVVAELPKIRVNKDIVQITGQFGVFAEGNVCLRFEDTNGQELTLSVELPNWSVEPRLPVALHAQWPREVFPVEQIGRIMIWFTEKCGAFSGKLSQIVHR